MDKLLIHYTPKGDIIKTLTKILIATTSYYFGLFSLGQIYECFLYWQVFFLLD